MKFYSLFMVVSHVVAKICLGATDVSALVAVKHTRHDGGLLSCREVSVEGYVIRGIFKTAGSSMLMLMIGVEVKVGYSFEDSATTLAIW